MELSRRRDGAEALTIVRADGSSTGKRYAAAQARFFAAHDLTHWVVERTLRLRQGFFGLVLGGMDLDTFGAPETKGVRLPDEAIAVEILIGLLEAQRRGLGSWTVGAMHALLVQACAQRGVQPLPPLDDARRDALLQDLDAQLAHWAAVPAGDVLQLPLDW